MSEFTRLREAVDTLADLSPSPDFAELQRRATRRGRRRLVTVAAVTALVVAGTVLAGTRLDSDRRNAPLVQTPNFVVGAVPVWYDANGLHRGDVVEQIPVEILVPEHDLGGGQIESASGALALTRSGALYLDVATENVWFHPWSGEPRIVGRASAAGPGGDPNGDTAAWFEGTDLVVYDTATGHEISRSSEAYVVSIGSGIGGDHFPPGNGFLEVSADRIVWTDGPGMYSHDLRTGETAVFRAPSKGFPADVQGDVEVEGVDNAVELRVAGRVIGRYPHLEPHLRLSPSGSYLLAPGDNGGRHGAAIVDTSTGARWWVPNVGYTWIAWSYGDIALLDTDKALLACDASRRTCERVPAERPFVMPTN